MVSLDDESEVTGKLKKYDNPQNLYAVFRIFVLTIY